MENKLQFWFAANREKALCLGAVIGSVILLLTVGVFLLIGARENFEEAQGLRLRLEGIRRFQQQVDFGQVRSELINKLQSLEDKLPEQLATNELLLRISAQAASEGIKVENLAAQQEQRKIGKQPRSLPISIVCQGQCQNLLDFMKNLEKDENLMFFTDVTMEQRENNQVALSATMLYLLR